MPARTLTHILCGAAQKAWGLFPQVAVGHNSQLTKRDQYALWTAPTDLTNDMVFV